MGDTSSKESGVAVRAVHFSPQTRKGEALAPRGSIVVYVAEAGSERLEAIHQAARKGVVSSRLLSGVDKAPDEASAKVTLRYGDRVLAAGVAVPAGGRAVRLVLPYAGAELDLEALRIEAEDEAAAVAGVAVLHAPPLSRIEEAALLLVSKADVGLLVGAALPGAIAADNDEERRAAEEARLEREAANAEARAEAAAARAEARAEARAGGRVFDVHLLDATVRALGPAAAASEMLALRRELLIEG